MKGIILAGDSGSKLKPLTLGIPKQLLPIYDKPMIFYPIEMLRDAGIIDILIITSDEHQPLFQKALSDGETLGVRISYSIQKHPDGVAQAISIAEDFIGLDDFCLMTGDTIIDGRDINALINTAIRTVEKSGNATIFVEKKTYPGQYGKVIIENSGKIMEITGDNGESYYYSIASFYIFPNSAVRFVDNLSISERGRLEITDLNKLFFDKCKLQIRFLDKECVWLDTNTFDNLLKCSEFMSMKRKS